MIWVIDTEVTDDLSDRHWGDWCPEWSTLSWLMIWVVGAEGSGDLMDWRWGEEHFAETDDNGYDDFFVRISRQIKMKG